MSDHITKDDVRTILKEELPGIVTAIVTPIITEAIKANNEILVSMFKTEILAIYEEFGKVHSQFDKVRSQFDTVNSRLDTIETKLDDHEKKIDALQSDVTTFKKDTTRQIGRLHSEVSMAIGYRSVITDIDQRVFLLEEKAIYQKKKE